MRFRPTSHLSPAAASRSRSLLKASAILLAASCAVQTAPAQTADNLGPVLHELASDYAATTPKGAAALTHAQFLTLKANYPLVRTDAADRVMVNVFLDGTQPAAAVVKAAGLLGGTVIARADWYRQGAFSVLVPINKAAALAQLAGVNSVLLDAAPRRHVGLATSQGTNVLRSAAVNALGYYGAGITVGALSDSFGTATGVATTAAQDEADDDLPGPGSAHNKTPVNVLEDFNEPYSTDEGRAMCQIIHDVAPAANIAFATAFESEISFAQNIIALATPTNQTVTISGSSDTIPAGNASGAVTVHGGGCQVICDDVSYFDEPMFSDGILAQAVDQVAAKYGVSYFSSAGNDGASGYAATYNPQTNNGVAQYLLQTQGSITYTDIPNDEARVIESFHVFGTDSKGDPVLVQKVMEPLDDGYSYPGIIVFQWDDPYSKVVNGVNQLTTDYDILVFQLTTTKGVTTAKYLSQTSGLSQNFLTNVPLEIPNMELTPGVQYEFVIARTNRKPAPGVTPDQATHIRWAVLSDAAGVIADYVTNTSPETYGHPTAAECSGTAAYVYDIGYNAADKLYQPRVESYSSNGPVTIYLDANGNRLLVPQTRLQPTLSAVDGVDTSFFGGDSDGDGLPNFFGTSAAAPHAAGCAALLLNAAQTPASGPLAGPGAHAADPDDPGRVRCEPRPQPGRRPGELHRLQPQHLHRSRRLHDHLHRSEGHAVDQPDVRPDAD